MTGIHHITALCSDPQRNIDFYAGLLGLRLVKKTVNYDDPATYHLYYGDGVGSPGTIMTFFAWILPPLATANARPGTGMITATPFRIAETSLDFWLDRLAGAGVDFDGPETRFGEQVVSLVDPDQLPLELVARPGPPPTVPWSDGPVPPEHAIRGLAGATISLDAYEPTAHLLTEVMKLRPAGTESSRFRFQIGHGDSDARIDLLFQPGSDPGRIGIGAVHHIAWRSPSPEAQQQWRAALVAAGYDVTTVRDRTYFSSIYYREPGGVLFELATDGPGFTADEPAGQLGNRLKLPAWLEGQRERIVARLPELRNPTWR